MEPGAVSSPPLATRPPTQPTQIFTRTRTCVAFRWSPAAGSGLEVSTAAARGVAVLDPNHAGQVDDAVPVQAVADQAQARSGR